MLLSIRQADSQDVAVIVEFNCRLADESEHRTLDASLVRAGVEALFADAHKGFYIVACNENRVVGKLMITKEWS